MHIFVLSIFIALSLVSCKSGPPAAQEVQLPPVPVKFEAANFKSLSENLETVGELKADKEALVSAEESGQVEEILVSEGETVSQGQVLIKIKANDIRADLDLANSDYERYKTLEAEGAVSRQELDEVEARVKRYEANLANREIKALFSGVVGEIYVDLGDYVDKGSQILYLVKNFPLRVTYSLPEKTIPYLKLGTNIQITTDAFPGQFFNCTMDFISPRVNPDTRAVLVRAKLNNYKAYSVLKANQFVKVIHPLKATRSTIAVKEQSIYLDQGEQFLYLAIPQETEKSSETDGDTVTETPQEYIAERVAIQTGMRKDGYVEILDGIKAGDLVVYAGLQRIFPGAKLLDVTQ